MTRWATTRASAQVGQYLLVGTYDRYLSDRRLRWRHKVEIVKVTKTHLHTPRRGYAKGTARYSIDNGAEYRPASQAVGVGQTAYGFEDYSQHLHRLALRNIEGFVGIEFKYSSPLRPIERDQIIELAALLTNIDIPRPPVFTPEDLDNIIQEKLT